MEIKRTANAGVLIKIDGMSILLDGVCDELAPYLGTPENIREELTLQFPDIVAFTHKHKDHFDESYAEYYEKKTLRPIYGSEMPFSEKIGNVTLTPVLSRHIGKVELLHASFVISGSKCIWFMGDASPLVLKEMGNMPKPDVVIVPYAYAITESAWRMTKGLGADAIVLIHLPLPENDTYGLWKTVEEVTQGDSCLYIPKLGESIFIH
ncbi:MAG: MBL fold metallo-hydrolase [Clostridia bacterium]|nr:MBL fold metallo-hydrolase [Clostridia bacterium]